MVDHPPRQNSGPIASISHSRTDIRTNTRPCQPHRYKGKYCYWFLQEACNISPFFDSERTDLFYQIVQSDLRIWKLSFTYPFGNRVLSDKIVPENKSIIFSLSIIFPSLTKCFFNFLLVSRGWLARSMLLSVNITLVASHDFINYCLIFSKWNLGLCSWIWFWIMLTGQWLPSCWKLLALYHHFYQCLISWLVLL